MEKIFEEKHPNVDVQREAAGSAATIRKITDLHKEADVVASADYTLINSMMIDSDTQYADWNIRFATNQLVLCYTDQSRFAGEVTGRNWYDILCRKGVVWGHSDPNLDPCGYRAVMVLQLAEKFYQKDGLYDRLIANRPEENIRPKSVELVSLLVEGDGTGSGKWEIDVTRGLVLSHEVIMDIDRPTVTVAGEKEPLADIRAEYKVTFRRKLDKIIEGK